MLSTDGQRKETGERRPRGRSLSGGGDSRRAGGARAPRSAPRRSLGVPRGHSRSEAPSRPWRAAAPRGVEKVKLQGDDPPPLPRPPSPSTLSLSLPPPLPPRRLPLRPSPPPSLATLTTQQLLIPPGLLHLTVRRCLLRAGAAGAVGLPGFGHARTESDPSPFASLRPLPPLCPTSRHRGPILPLIQANRQSLARSDRCVNPLQKALPFPLPFTSAQHHIRRCLDAVRPLPVPHKHMKLPSARFQASNFVIPQAQGKGNGRSVREAGFHLPKHRIPCQLQNDGVQRLFAGQGAGAEPHQAPGCSGVRRDYKEVAKPLVTISSLPSSPDSPSPFLSAMSSLISSPQGRPLPMCWIPGP